MLTSYIQLFRKAMHTARSYVLKPMPTVPKNSPAQSWHQFV